MRLALCLYGLVGSLDGKSGYFESSKLESLRLGAEYWKRFFIDRYDTDVYIHSWEVDIKKDITKAYNPKKILFEKQRTFNVPDYILGTEKRKQNHYSRWYSQMMSYHLLKEAASDGAKKYNFVMSARFDIAWKRNIYLKDLNPNIIYYPGKKKNNHKISDLWFISSPKNMSKFCNLYTHLDNYCLPPKKIQKYKNNKLIETWDKGQTCSTNKLLGISSHRLAIYHMRKLGIESSPLLWQSEDPYNSDFAVIRDIHGEKK